MKNRVPLLISAVTTVLFAASAYSAPAPESSLQNLLPESTRRHYSQFLSDAKKLKQAIKEIEQKKSKFALAKLKNLTNSDTFGDIALLELSKLEAAQQNYSSAQTHLQSLLRRYPLSPWSESASELLKEVDINAAIASVQRAHTKDDKRKALKESYRALSGIPWKNWSENEDAVRAIVELSAELKDPLAEAYASEALLALPVDSNYRQTLVQNLGIEESKRLANLAKFRPNPAPIGVPKIAPDQQLIESGMTKVLEENWTGALEDFLKLEESYPQSEHLDRAKFWIGNCMEETGETEKAKAKFQEIFQSSPLSYYGLHSADKLKVDLKEFVKEMQVQQLLPLTGIFLPRQQIYIWRALALLETEQQKYSSKELEALYKFRPQGAIFGQNTPQQSLQLAALYFKGNYFPGAFLHTHNAIGQDRTLINKASLSLLFPRVYLEESQNAAKETGLELFLLLSIIKQESGFRADVVSRRDAMGLMQILQSTGREMLPDLKRKDLFSPEKNIKLGSMYVKKLLDRFGGNLPLALAAYNAGPSRVAQWQKKILETPLMKKGFRADAFIDSIPFQETRKYVGNILRNQRFYSLIAN